MGFLDGLDQTITGWGQNALKKTRDMTDTVKIQSTISNLENRKKDAFTELGKMFYETFKTYGGNPSEDELHMIEVIDQIEQQIDQYSKQLQRVKGVSICPNCHSEIPANSMFCSSCGFKIPVRTENYQGARKSLFCQNCGAALGQGQMFCTNCGTRVETGNEDTVQKNSYTVEANYQSVQKTSFCQNCGAVLGSGQVFCTNCGTPVEEKNTDMPEKYTYYDNSNIVENDVSNEGNEQEETLGDQIDGNLCEEECCSDMELKCPNCGEVISEDITFCTSCGTRIK